MRRIVFVREGLEYPIIFNIPVAKAVTAKYGSLQKLTEMLEQGDLEATGYVLAKMVEEGVLYENDLLGKHTKPPPETLIPRMITFADLSDAALSEALTDALLDFTGGNAGGQLAATTDLATTVNTPSTSPVERTSRQG